MYGRAPPRIRGKQRVGLSAELNLPSSHRPVDSPGAQFESSYLAGDTTKNFAQHQVAGAQPWQTEQHLGPVFSDKKWRAASEERHGTVERRHDLAHTGRRKAVIFNWSGEPGVHSRLPSSSV